MFETNAWLEWLSCDVLSWNVSIHTTGLSMRKTHMEVVQQAMAIVEIEV